MTRDELARHLYVVQPCGPDVPLTAGEQAAGAEEWDAGQVKSEDVNDCYARADRIMAGAEAPR